MMDLNSIRAMNEEAEEKARRLRKQPYVAKFDKDVGVRNAPFIGDYVPDGWEVTETFFVDASGFGVEGEPALTFQGFLNKVKKGRGYAIVEQGQFQVYITEYRRTKR